MNKQSRHHHDKAAGVGGRLKQRLAQILVRSSCATTSATAFVGQLPSTSNAGAAVTAADSVSRQQEPRAASRARTIRPNDDRRQRRPPDLRRSSNERALVHISVDCSARSVGAAAGLHFPPVPAKRDAVMKSSRRRSSDKVGNHHNNNKMRASSYYYPGWSSSSSSTDGVELAATFSSDGDGDTRQLGGEEADTARSSTLFSSRSFSSDSTTGGGGSASARSKSKRHSKKNRRSRRAPRPVRGDDGTFRRRPELGKETEQLGDDNNNNNNKVDDAVAVVKRSHNPYADFRRSMVEMVAGRRIRGADALTELLVRYLSLNSPRHHPVILSAFDDIWEAVIPS